MSLCCFPGRANTVPTKIAAKNFEKNFRGAGRKEGCFPKKFARRADRSVGRNANRQSNWYLKRPAGGVEFYALAYQRPDGTGSAALIPGC